MPNWWINDALPTLPDLQKTPQRRAYALLLATLP